MICVVFESLLIFSSIDVAVKLGAIFISSREWNGASINVTDKSIFSHKYVLEN